jgi:predicted dehydrogenase
VVVTAAAINRVSTDLMGEDVALVSLQAASGAVGSVAGNFSAAGYPPLPSDRLELVGETGSILFEDGVLRRIGRTQETLRYDFDAMYQQSYDNAIAHFVECRHSGTPFETDRRDNLNTLRLVADAYRLAGRGNP